MNSPRRSTICVKTSGDTRQSLNISSRLCAHVGVIFSPPHLGLSIGHMGWKRLIQQEVTGCNEGPKMRDSKFIVDVKQHQVMLHTVLALAQRVHATSDRRHALANVQVEPFDKGGIHLPATG